MTRNSTINGMSAAGIQAPLVNLDTRTMTMTTAVATAPVALIARPTLQWGSRSRQWCTTIPACDRVNPVKTPTA